jgi:hypothetical protein
MRLLVETLSATKAWVKQHLTGPILGFWVIALIPFIIENSNHLLSQLTGGECDPHRHEAGSFYPWARRFAGARNPFLKKPDNVRLVAYSVRNEGPFVMGNFCETREFTSHVLRKLVSWEPAVIVIDWYNLSERCKKDDKGTQDLIKAVDDVTKGRVTKPDPKDGSFNPVPVIAARSTYREDRLPQGEYIGRKDVLDGHAQFASIRLDDCEEDRIPFRWKVRAEPDQAAELLDTISLAAVRAANQPGAIEDLAPFIQHENRPYVSLFPENEFPGVAAIDVLCEERPKDSADYTNCKERRPGDPTLTDLSKKKKIVLRNKIVILADVSTREDLHGTFIGELPGAVLHANYIEAMINKNYLRPVHPLIQLIVSLIWFLAIEWVFVQFAHRPLYALSAALAVIAVFIVIFFFLFVQISGLNFVLLPPSLLLVFIRTCYALGEWQAMRLKPAGHGVPVQAGVGGTTI